MKTVTYFACVSVLLVFLMKECLSQKSCPFMGYGRVAKPVTNLGNCTWYEDLACCERAEVSSVFAEMLPLQDATTDCRNYMNYLMCYFCSPLQKDFVFIAPNGIRQTRICPDFSKELFEHCRSARYQGRALGEVYSSGEAFCQANAFQVYPNNCLPFNASAFPSSGADSALAANLSFLLLLIVVSFCVLCSI